MKKETSSAKTSTKPKGDEKKTPAKKVGRVSGILAITGVPQPFLSMGRYSDVGPHPTHPYSFSFNF